MHHPARFICFVLVGGLTVLAQGADANRAGSTPATRAASPTLPDLSKSPVDEFRELLVMTPTRQEEILAAKYSAEQRKQLRAKIQEYGSMPSEQREARLRLVQLRWYLLPLMQLPPSERADKLAAVPEEYRQLIEERLKQWDILPPPMKKDVLDHEWTVHYFVRMEARTPAQREEALKTLPAENRQMVEEKLADWRALPIERRQRMSEHVHQFFELKPKEKEKTLDALADEERLKMEASLQQFEKLSPEHRKICIEAFEKFASMTLQERAQFLKNAERWKIMSAQERETWRNLVTLLPASSPPMPPGLDPKATPNGANKQSPPQGTTRPEPALPGSSGRQ